MGEQAVVAAANDVLRAVLDRACREAGASVVDRVGTVQAAAAACRLGPPRVLVIDLDLPDADGLLAEVGTARPQSVVVVADRTDGDAVLRALRLGARAFVSKADGLGDLGRTIRRVIAGERAIAPELEVDAIRALGRLARRARESAKIAAGLSRREREVLRLLSGGMTVGQVASRLGISPRTVESHVTRLYRKLGVRTRLQAVSRAATLGLVEL
jgi:DNA-binding NarL/FixJ family response regulator